MRRSKTPSYEEAIAFEIMRAQAQQMLARGGLSEIDEAAYQLRAEGIIRATPLEIEARVEHNREAARRQAEAEAREKAATEVEASQPPPEHPAPTPQQAPQPAPKPKRGRGRPPKNESWLYEVAELHAQGYTLRRALKKAGVTWLSDTERRGIYRLKRFRQLVQHCRREHFKS